MNAAQNIKCEIAAEMSAPSLHVPETGEKATLFSCSAVRIARGTGKKHGHNQCGCQHCALSTLKTDAYASGRSPFDASDVDKTSLGATFH